MQVLLAICDPLGRLERRFMELLGLKRFVEWLDRDKLFDYGIEYLT